MNGRCQSFHLGRVWYIYSRPVFHLTETIDALLAGRRFNEASTVVPLSRAGGGGPCKGCRETRRANDVRDNPVIAFRRQLPTLDTSRMGYLKIALFRIYSSSIFHQLQLNRCKKKGNYRICYDSRTRSDR